MGSARACNRQRVLKQKALRTVCVGRREGTPSVLKPQQLSLILGLAVIPKFVRTKHRRTCRATTAIGRKRFPRLLWVGKATLTSLSVSPVPSVVILSRRRRVANVLRTWSWIRRN